MVMRGRTFGIRTALLIGALVNLWTLAPAPAFAGPTTHSNTDFSVDNVSHSEGNTGSTTTFTFTITYSGSAPATTANITTADGTAKAAEGDYVAKSSTTPVAFTTATPTQTFAVTVNGDDIPEPDETFFVQVRDTNVPTTDPPAQGTGTILNDDGAPPSLSVSNETITESDSSQFLNFTVTRSGPTDGPVAAHATATETGTAVIPADFGPADATVSFPAGVTQQTFSVPISGDHVYEGKETFAVVLSNPDNAVIDANPGGVGTINDNDPPTSYVSNAALAGWEMQARKCSDRAASAPNEMSFVPGPLTPPSGQGSLQWTLGITADIIQRFRTSQYDGYPLSRISELQYSTFVQTASSQPPYFRLLVDGNGDGQFVQDGTNDFALMFIPVNNDVTAATVGVWKTWDMLGTGSGFNLDTDTGKDARVTLAKFKTDHPNARIIANATGGGVEVVQGGGDCGAGESTTTNADAIRIGMDAKTTLYDLEGAGTIQFTAAQLSVDESQPAATVTITRTGGLAGPVSARFLTTDATATAGTDYTAVDQVVTFAAGETQKTVSVPIIADDKHDSPERLSLSLSDPTNSAVLGSPAGATLTITEDSVRFSPTSYTVNESSGTAHVVVQRSSGTTASATVRVKTADGTATAGTDYTAVDTVVSFAAGATSKTVDIPILEDNGTEAGERFTVSLSEPTGTALAPASTATVDIVDDAPGAASSAPSQGYVLVGGDGGVFAFGKAQFKGSLGDKKLNQPIIGIAYKPDGLGYWLVAKDGGVFSFGNADFHGSMGDKHLNAPVLGIEPTPTGLGYWLFAADGGIFSFGDAKFHGSMGDKALNAPVIGMTASTSGTGYWLVGTDGGIFTFDAPFFGSTGSMRLNQPVFDMAPMPGDAGYWLVARDGGIFTFPPNGPFYGAAVGKVTGSVIGMGTSPSGAGYWIADANGKVVNLGDAASLGDRSGLARNAPFVAFATVPSAAS
jgi:hypothetical protein